MLGINKLFGQKSAKVASVISEPSVQSSFSSRSQSRQQTYSKVFRWRLPAGQAEAPELVQIVGSFTQWQKVELLRDRLSDTWQATVHQIVGNKTHHYMILVNNQPVNDPHADGFAAPEGEQEEQYQLMTPRGARVFMLFAQAK